MTGERILVVEDDADARRLLGMILNAEGVEPTCDGEAALAKVARHPRT